MVWSTSKTRATIHPATFTEKQMQNLATPCGKIASQEAVLLHRVKKRSNDRAQTTGRPHVENERRSWSSIFSPQRDRNVVCREQMPPMVYTFVKEEKKCATGRSGTRFRWLLHDLHTPYTYKTSSRKDKKKPIIVTSRTFYRFTIYY